METGKMEQRAREGRKRGVGEAMCGGGGERGQTEGKLH